MNEIRDKLIRQMKGVFGGDLKRISHAMAVLGYAERIQTVEGGDEAVVTAAAILHDIGIHQAELKYKSAAGKYQEIEGPPIAEKILNEEGFDVKKIEHICKIIANHHSAKNIDTPEFRVIWDADWLVNIPDECGNMDAGKLKEFVGRIFKTDTGRKIARELYLHEN